MKIKQTSTSRFSTSFATHSISTFFWVFSSSLRCKASTCLFSAASFFSLFAILIRFRSLLDLDISSTPNNNLLASFKDNFLSGYSARNQFLDSITRLSSFPCADLVFFLIKAVLKFFNLLLECALLRSQPLGALGGQRVAHDVEES